MTDEETHAFSLASDPAPAQDARDMEQEARRLEREKELIAHERKTARREGCLRGCLLSVALLVGLFIAMILIPILAAKSLFSEFEKGLKDGLSGKDVSESDLDFTADASGLKEIWISGGDTDEGCKVARIPLQGTISMGKRSGFGSMETGAAFTLRAIRRATQDPDVCGILLMVDSGGGGITASDILYDALKEFKKSDPHRKIVVLMEDTAASGAYYASLAADKILAHPTTLTGSIGVILPSFNVHELAGKIGVSDSSITSGSNKDMLNPMKEETPEQRAILQGTVDELYERFAGLVAENRGIPLDEVKKIADGRVYTAKQALDLKLIDGIGYLRDAEAEMKAQLDPKEGDIEYVAYEEVLSFKDLFSSSDFWGAALGHALPNVVEPATAR